jgi:hypothetical protein
MNSRILVIAPYYQWTGGVEALHTFASRASIIGHEAIMVYLDVNNFVRSGDLQLAIKPRSGLSDRYGDYNIASVDSLPTSYDRVLIPEIYPFLAGYFGFSENTILWWLSADNYFISQQQLYDSRDRLSKSFDFFPTFDDLSNCTNIFQSRHAKNVVSMKMQLNHDYMLLTSPLNHRFRDQAFRPTLANRNRDVLFNPVKNGHIYDYLKPLLPEVKLVPIQGMTTGEIVERLRAAKIYLDLGTHPGRDRLPREAATQGCCITVSNTGAAAVYEDYPFSENYKLDIDNIQTLPDRLREVYRRICNQHSETYADFEEYRHFISGESERFDSALQALLASIGQIAPKSTPAMMHRAESNPIDPASWGEVSRNELCLCGSGKRFKHCHGKLA